MPYKNPEDYKLWYERNRERKIAQVSANYQNQTHDEREKHNARMRDYYRRCRQKCFDHYGRQCACCGETELLFLTFDHINGGGRKHNEKVGYIPRWLVSQGFPDGFQVLCMNCNLGRSINGGVCPHQEKI